MQLLKCRPPSHACAAAAVPAEPAVRVSVSRVVLGCPRAPRMGGPYFLYRNRSMRTIGSTFGLGYELAPGAHEMAPGARAESVYSVA